ncbi:hypothetical protein K8B83_18405 [Shewanella inventionis]|uniref:MSHA biogenesis protein MshJ n=1 Tax=Shewanella inventionis TaxID=1738770 RepID=A0ABQ1JHX9_9GAMM|nr:DUF6776 family protein [Shewanella inventionis]MCL1158296.1 hypothetical protein [Shewanella inventionis]UAL42768.1 hypothetical protein K8B83_18405 [Shewanella inventionis]GGB66755.1 hypothetical protein GCM10011607_29250 [Shewanella inventionis]
MLNYHRWLDRLQVLERKNRTSSKYLLSLMFVSFLLGAVSYNVWLSFAPEATPNSASGKRKLLQQLDEQAQVLASRNLALSIAENANKEMQDMFSRQLVEQKTLEKELAFYRSVMVTDADAEGVAINTVELVQGASAERFQLRIVLTQLQKRKTKVKANAEVTLIGSQNGKASSLNLNKLLNKKLAFEFSYFQIMDSDIVLPAGFSLQKIAVKVTVNASRGVKGGSIEQTYNVPELLMGEKELRVILEQNSQVKDNSQ